MEILDVGYKNYIAANKITAVLCADVVLVKKLVKVAKEENRYIDATRSRKTRSVIVTSDNFLIGVAFDPAVIRDRLRDEY